MTIAIFPDIILSLCLLSILVAPIGCLLIWQNHSYLSDSISHSCIIAALVASIVSVPLILCMTATSIISVILALILQKWYDGNLSINLTTGFLVVLL